MKSFLLGLCFLIMTVLSISIMGCQSAVDNIVEIQLKKEAEACNKKGAMEMGNGVRIDSASSSGKTIRFNYTMLNIGKGNINAQVFYKSVKAELVKAANTNPDMEFYRKNKIKVTYAYFYNNGTPLSTIIIKPEDYTDEKK